MRPCVLCNMENVPENKINNPWPIVSQVAIIVYDLVCCDDCNAKKVIPARINEYKKRQRKNSF